MCMAYAGVYVHKSLGLHQVASMVCASPLLPVHCLFLGLTVSYSSWTNRGMPSGHLSYQAYLLECIPGFSRGAFPFSAVVSH